MTDREIWKHVMADLAYLRNRIDEYGVELKDHVKDETKYQRCIAKQIYELHEAVEVSSTVQKVKMSGMEKGVLIVIVAFVSTFTSWAFTRFTS